MNEDKKTETINLRVSKSEKEELERKANKVGVPLSEYVRKSCIDRDHNEENIIDEERNDCLRNIDRGIDAIENRYTDVNKTLGNLQYHLKDVCEEMRKIGNKNDNVFCNVTFKRGLSLMSIALVCVILWAAYYILPIAYNYYMQNDLSEKIEAYTTYYNEKPERLTKKAQYELDSLIVKQKLSEKRRVAAVNKTNAAVDKAKPVMKKLVSLSIGFALQTRAGKAHSFSRGMIGDGSCKKCINML